MERGFGPKGCPRYVLPSASGSSQRPSSTSPILPLPPPESPPPSPSFPPFSPPATTDCGSKLPAMSATARQRGGRCCCAACRAYLLRRSRVNRQPQTPSCSGDLTTWRAAGAAARARPDARSSRRRGRQRRRSRTWRLLCRGTPANVWAEVWQRTPMVTNQLRSAPAAACAWPLPKTHRHHRVLHRRPPAAHPRVRPGRHNLPPLVGLINPARGLLGRIEPPLHRLPV